MGCLTLIILAVIGVFGIFSMFTDSIPTQHAIEQASQHPKVIELLGTPLEDYGFPTGKMSYSSDSGNEVDFVIPVKGPKGKGSITIIGTEKDGVWNYEELSVQIEGEPEDINLLEKVLEGF